MTQFDQSRFGTGGEEAAAAVTKAGDPWAVDVHPLAGRLKFECCFWCGSAFGMDSSHRDTLRMVDDSVLLSCAPWYRSPDVGEYLYYPCFRCNPQGRVPDGFTRLTIAEVREWVSETEVE